MVCSKAEWVELFVAGRLEGESLLAMEAHIEGCEECFLRVAVDAGAASEAERWTLSQRSTPGSRLGRALHPDSKVSTTEPQNAATKVTPESSRRTVGPYAVTGILGMGGMSIVYRARHQVTDREVAVKTVKMPFVASFLAMLRQEVEFLRETQHPGT